MSQETHLGPVNKYFWELSLRQLDKVVLHPELFAQVVELCFQKNMRTRVLNFGEAVHTLTKTTLRSFLLLLTQQLFESI